MATSVACAFFFDAARPAGPGRHAVDACARRAKPVSRTRGIFMHKGDTPFCSEDCRYEQMHHDAAYARQAASSRRKQQQSQRSRGASSVGAKADVSVAS